MWSHIYVIIWLLFQMFPHLSRISMLKRSKLRKNEARPASYFRQTTQAALHIHTCLTLHNHPNPNTLFQFGYFPKVPIYPSVLTMPSHCPASTSPPFLSPHHPPAGFSRSFAHHSSIALCIHICEDWRGWSLNGKLSLFCRCYNHSKELSDWTNNYSWEMWTEG